MKSKNQIIAPGVFILLNAFATQSFAQQYSTSAQAPTRLERATITGKVTPEKGKGYYVSFLTGPGNVFFDVKISPKENNGAVFYWIVYRSIADAVKDKPWCPENLYLATAKKTECVTTSGDKQTRQVVLKFGATPNSTSVNLDYTITLSGDWKPIPLPVTKKPLPIKKISGTKKKAILTPKNTH